MLFTISFPAFIHKLCKIQGSRQLHYPQRGRLLLDQQDENKWGTSTKQILIPVVVKPTDSNRKNDLLFLHLSSVHLNFLHKARVNSTVACAFFQGPNSGWVLKWRCAVNLLVHPCFTFMTCVFCLDEVKRRDYGFIYTIKDCFCGTDFPVVQVLLFAGIP